MVFSPGTGLMVEEKTVTPLSGWISMILGTGEISLFHEVD